MKVKTTGLVPPLIKLAIVVSMTGQALLIRTGHSCITMAPLFDRETENLPVNRSRTMQVSKSSWKHHTCLRVTLTSVRPGLSEDVILTSVGGVH